MGYDIKFLRSCFILALLVLLVPGGKLSPAQEPTGKEAAAASNYAEDLNRKIRQAVKELDYDDKAADDFVQRVGPWKLDVLYQKICQAAQDVKQQKISWSQYAQAEEQIVQALAEKIRKEISLDKEFKCFDLAQVVKYRKAQSLGYSQLIYILGNSLGLTVKAVDVREMSNYALLPGFDHTACAVGMHNGKAMLVDLVVGLGKRNAVSAPFPFKEAYRQAGGCWELKDKNNRLNLHRRIRLLDKNGLIACIHNCRGIEFSESGNVNDAFAEYNKALEFNPKDASVYNNRGIAYADLGEYDHAIADYNKAIEIDPKFAAACKNLGAAYGQISKYDQAIANFNKAIELNPIFAEAYGLRGTAKAIVGEKEEAKKDLRKAVELDPQLRETVKRVSDQFKLNL